MIRIRLPQFVCATTLLATCGCLGTALAQPQSGTLRVRLNADIRSIDPGMNRDANTDGVMMHIMEGLVAYREDTSVGPLLAQSYETSADG